MLAAQQEKKEKKMPICSPLRTGLDWGFNNN